MGKWDGYEDEKFEKIRRGGNSNPDDRRLSKKDRTSERTTARKGKQMIRSFG